MSIRDWVRADYQEYVSLNAHKYPSEMIRSLKHNERVPGFIDNLCKEMKALDNETIVLKKQRLFTRENIKTCVYSLTEWFLVNLKRHADEKNLSDLEKSRIIKEQTDRLEIDRLANEILNESIDRSEEL